MCILGTRVLLNYNKPWVTFRGVFFAETPRGGGMHYTLEVFLNSARPPCILFFVWVFREMIWAREPKWGGGEEAVWCFEV